MKRICLFFLAWPFAVLGQVTLDSSSLPIVRILTDGKTILDEPKIQARMQITDRGPGLVNHLSDPPNHYDGYIGIEWRGSTSQFFSDKKPYSVETRKADSTDLAVALLGLPKESDWVFIAPFSDKSLVRDAFALELARRIMPWASHGRFVELLVNDEYQGIYLVAEKIKRDKNRVNIAKLDSDDLAGDSLTGGYIIKLDKTTGATADGWESPYFSLPGGWQRPFYQYHVPKPEDIRPEQRQYIQQWMTAFEDAMYGPQFATPGIGYPKYLDVPSFIDFTLINEIAKNVDGYRLSTFLYKDRDSQNPHLFAGPVWDFNIGFGNVNYCAGDSYQGWAMDFNDQCGSDNWVIHFWWTKMWEDPAYRAQLTQRWKMLRSADFTDAKVMGIIDSLVSIVQPAQQRNFKRWPILQEWVWPNAFCCGAYSAHVQYFRNWVLNRLHWMDDSMKTLYIGEYNDRLAFPVKIFPNPAVGPLTISYYAHFSESIRLRLFDITGRLAGEMEEIPAFNGKGEATWAPDLAPGIYFYDILFNGQPNARGRLVIGP